MDFRQLEVFRTIADELHFGRAAQRLFIAQPSVSQQLQKLEADLGVRLIHRTSRSVQLTAAGKVLLGEANALFAARDRAMSLTRQAAAGMHGALRIATNYPASRLLLLPLLEELRAREPGLTTMLREMGSPEQLRALQRGDLDLGLVYGPVEEPGVYSEHLLDVPVVATVRRGHPLASSPTLDLARIRDFRHLTGYAGGSTVIEDALLTTAGEHGVRLQRSSNLMDLSGYLLELETTDTIGFSSLPRGEQSQANGMQLLRIRPAEPKLEIHVVWNAEHDEPLVNSVVAQLSRLARELNGLE